MPDEHEASLSLLDAVMIGMGAMIGAGIFVLTGVAAEIAGAAAIIVFLLNGIVTVFTGISYAELASGIPRSGGGFAFVNELFGEWPSFIMGWMLGFAYIIAGSLYALGFGANFVEFVHIYTLALPDVPIILGIGSVLLFVTLNVASTAASGSVETIITIIKIVILIIFSAFGALAVDVSQFDPILPAQTSGLAIVSAMGLTFIAFEGYDLITTVTEEVKNPRKNIPRAIFISLAATVLIYLVVVFVAIGTLGPTELGIAGETGIAEAAKGFMPPIPVLGTGAAFIAFGAVFSTLSALNAVIIASSRVIFAMGRDDYLPSSTGRISSRFGTPAIAVLWAGILMAIFASVVPLERVGRVSSLFFLLSFIIVNGAVIKLRRDRPEIERTYEMPLYPLPPILAIILNAVLAVTLVFDDPVSGAIAAAWIGLGVITYTGFKQYQSSNDSGE